MHFPKLNLTCEVTQEMVLRIHMEKMVALDVSDLSHTTHMYSTFLLLLLLLLLLLIFKDSPTGKGTLVEGVSVERWNYMLL